MNLNDSTLVELSCPRPRPSLLAGLARRLVHARLDRMRHGRLVLHEQGESSAFGPAGGVEVNVTVRHPAFYPELAFGGSVGAGEAYMLGHWVADDLTALVRLLLRNREALDGMEGGLARLSSPMRTAAHWLHRNTREGSRRNISAHYDLGNELYRLFLDETMMYSSAIFERPGMTLAEAQAAKLEAICRKLELGPDDHVLEIGTGWGGFALHAAGKVGCRVTTTTISPNQHALATERVRAAGLQDRVTVLLQDYRELEGTYDKLVSIEMIEAVGHQYFGEFFRRCDALLRPGGRMLLQAITIADQRYEQARREVDFIKRYIFPGCCIPSVTALANAMTDASRLRIVALEDIGLHYATTLASWRDNFLRNSLRVQALGYPETFIRMWTFYLAYCEGGFAERALGDLQLVLERGG
ncbi:MAG: cyclopropane-fatty-acyl-phospholipid synthase [Proteobacteria bacterium]|nr:cyclopropane-fatty-acyl-phospholipid synthase [Pseudomonadota bacterium]